LLRGVGVLPERCIVVDAVAGIEGARRAGMRSIGVSRNGHQLSADVTVRSLDLLYPYAFDLLLDAGRLSDSEPWVSRFK